MSPVYVDRSTAGEHEVFEDTDGKCGIQLGEKCNRLLLLVAPARSGPEEALWWFLSQLLRYFFCGICGNELEGLVLVA